MMSSDKTGTRSARLPGIATAALLQMRVAEASAAATQSAFDPAGPQAESIWGLTHLLTWACIAVYVVVMIAFALALRRKRGIPPPREELLPGTGRRFAGVVWAAAGTTVAILFLFLLASLRTDRALAERERIEHAITIRVTGKQWWWDVYYEDRHPANSFWTANEIHVPLSRPVLLKLHTADVIHSLWIPSLQGKKDAIPGRENELWLEVSREGEYVGQCAEFCGLQHAHMALLVVAESPEKFEAWRAAQREAAGEPGAESARRGRGVFLGSTCVMCHAVRGTPAGSRVGPDLTHFASRRTIAAGTRPNTREHLAEWIRNPAQMKPGTTMPAHHFAPEELAALLDYLEGLR